MVVRGVEMNRRAAEDAQSRGIPVDVQSLSMHVEDHAGFYDRVCAFQVLEHIEDVGLFLSDMSRCLKPGGVLLLAVPNNESFIGNQPTSALNYPPHHLGWWDPGSLRRIVEYFPLELIDLEYEPLQHYHYDWYAEAMSSRLQPRVMRLPGAWRLLRPLKAAIRLGLPPVARFIHGHTVAAAYKKQ